MENFKITFDMETPFIVDRFTTIDSILISEFFKLMKEDNQFLEFSDDLSMINFIDRKNDVLSGSIWYIPKDNPIKLDFVSYYKKPDIKKVFDLTSKFSKKPASNDFLSSHTKAFALNDEIIATPEIYFYIRAKKEQLLKLLSRISYIGKKRNIGFGKVSSIEIKSMEEDCSFQLNNSTPSKPLPVKDFNINSKKVTFYRAIPPYWSNKDLIACYMPSTALIEYTDKSIDDKKFKVLDDLKFESGLGYISRLLSGKHGLPKVEAVKIIADTRKNRWEMVKNSKKQRCCITNEIDSEGVIGAQNYINTKIKTFASMQLVNDSGFISKTALWGMLNPVIMLTGDSIVQNHKLNKLTQKGAEEGYRFKDYIKNPYMLKPPFVIMRKVNSSKPEHVILGSKKALSNAFYPIQFSDKTYYIDSELLLMAVKDIKNILKTKTITKSHLLGLWRDKKHPSLGKNGTSENIKIVEDFQKKYDKTIRMSLFSVTDFD